MRDRVELTIARALLARGIPTIPIPRPRRGIPPGCPGDGKVPAIAWREYQTRLPTDDELVAWFARPMNLAAVTGAFANVIVVDADSRDALHWCTAHFPYTPWQTQTARGFHLWYRHPGVPVANRARLETRDGRLAIDVRGDGGFVIAPGSLHASGVRYAFAGDWTRDDVPRFWPGWLQRPPRPTPRPIASRPTGDVVDRARRYLAAIPVPEIGAGSDTATLYAACKLARGFGLCAADAEALLWEWAGGRPGWTRAWIAAKVAHAERYGTEPIGALR
jgi:Bifunctional DNA primase/polymerase, N-terminal